MIAVPKRAPRYHQQLIHIKTQSMSWSVKKCQSAAHTMFSQRTAQVHRNGVTSGKILRKPSVLDNTISRHLSTMSNKATTMAIPSMVNSRRINSIRSRRVSASMLMKPLFIREIRTGLDRDTTMTSCRISSPPIILPFLHQLSGTTRNTRRSSIMIITGAVWVATMWRMRISIISIHTSLCLGPSQVKLLQPKESHS